MNGRMPGAVWIGPTRNEGDGDGRPGEPADEISTVVGVVLHIQQGSELGTEAWQRNPKSQVSSHFLLPRAGGIRQMVDLRDRAWCQVEGNRHWWSVECEGFSGQPLTKPQIEACALILLHAHLDAGVRLAISNDWRAASPAAGGLGYHAMGGRNWGGHFQCPGTPVINQRGQIVARAVQMGGTMGDLTPEEHRNLNVDHWELTDSVQDPDNPTGDRMPHHVALTKLLAKVDALRADVTAIKNAVTPPTT